MSPRRYSEAFAFQRLFGFLLSTVLALVSVQIIRANNSDVYVAARVTVNVHVRPIVYVCWRDLVVALVNTRDL